MITTYQIRNVLRVYGNQLRRKNAFLKDGVKEIQQPADMVNISIEAKRRQMVSQMSNDLISKISHKNQKPSVQEEKNGELD